MMIDTIANNIDTEPRLAWAWPKMRSWSSSQ